MPNYDNASSEQIMQQLFRTNDPKGLFRDVYNKSVDISGGKKNISEGVEEEYETGYLPPVHLSKTTPQNTGNRIPKMMPENKQNNMLKSLLGEQYFNNLVKTPEGGGSILESVADKMYSGRSYSEDYEVVNDPPKQDNKISLIIEGKSYSGKIVQNKSGQILYLVGNNRAFVLTPSTIKTVSKK